MQRDIFAIISSGFNYIALVFPSFLYSICLGFLNISFQLFEFYLYF